MLARDHEYKRHGTLSLLAGIDLLTGHVHARVEDRHRSRELTVLIGVSTRHFGRSTAFFVTLQNR